MSHADDLQAQHETAMEALRQKHATQLAELETVYQIRKGLPDVGLPFSIHLHNLFGTVGSVGMKHDFYGIGGDKPQPTLATLAYVALALPPLPLVQVEDSCMSFQAAEYVYGREIKPHEKITRVCPFTVRLSAFQQHRAEFEWVARVSGLLVRVQIELPTPEALGRVMVRYEDLPGERIVSECTCILRGNTATINRRGVKLATAQRPIKFASGSRATPSPFVLYYKPESETVADVADLIASILGG